MQNNIIFIYHQFLKYVTLSYIRTVQMHVTERTISSRDNTGTLSSFSSAPLKSTSGALKKTVAVSVPRILFCIQAVHRMYICPRLSILPPEVLVELK